MSRGGAGEWDAVDVLNPSVIRQGDAYYNFFSGYDGKTWHTGLAVSADGVTWHKEGKILSPDRHWEGNGLPPMVAIDDSGILYYYQAGDPVADRTRAIEQRPSMGAQWSASAHRWSLRKLG